MLSFAKKMAAAEAAKTAPQTAAEAPAQVAPKKIAPATQPAPAEAKATVTHFGGKKESEQTPAADAPKKKFGFMKKGAEAAEMREKHAAAVQAQRDQDGKLWRFRIGPKEVGQDFEITFLDGALNEHGMLDTETWYEHTFQHAGKFMNVPAPNALDPSQPDVLAMAIGKEPALVGALTIINHTPYVSKKEGGKTYKDRRQLFVFKPTTAAILQKIASKLPGQSLAGWTFSVSRSGSKVPNVGDVFIPQGQRTLAELKALYGDDVAVPAVYEEEIVFYTNEDLKKMGITSQVKIVGSEEPTDGDLDDQL